MLFIDNKYTRWYYSIVTNAQSRILPEDTYTEKHHIIPKSLGGSNAKDNLVALTAREHFICHLLLTKMTVNFDRHKMHRAFFYMCVTNNRKYKVSSYTYEIAKLNQAQVMQTRIVTNETREKLSAAARTRKHSEETKQKMSNSRKGRITSDETKQKISNANRGRKLPPVTDATRAKLSLISKGRKMSEEEKAKRRKPKPPRSPEHCAALSAAHKARNLKKH